MSQENLTPPADSTDQVPATQKIAIAIATAPAPEPQQETLRLPKIARKLPVSSQKMMLLGSLGAMVVFVLLTSLVVLTKHSPSTSRGHGTATAVAATHPPTIAPTPTIGFGSSAIIGLPLTAFNAMLGSPVESYPDSATYNVTLGGIPMRVFVALTKGTDGASHVQAVRIAPQSGYLDLNNLKPVIYPFIPGDSIKQGDVDAYGNTYHVYRSVALSSVFPTSDFVTTTQQTATPGSFSWFCSTNQNFCYIGTIIPQQ